MEKEKEEERRLKRMDNARRKMFIKGHPSVTPNRQQRSINTFKDMYGIFETLKNEKKPDKVNHFAKPKP